MKEQTFETSIERLESIVKQLETGNISLEESIKFYEEGLTLAKNCSEKLENAKQKIIEIDNYLKELADE